MQKRKWKTRQEIIPPKILTTIGCRPKDGKTITLDELCLLADIPKKVTGAFEPVIVIHNGKENLIEVAGNNHILYVGLAQFQYANEQEMAIRVLETLAHGFHDYASRECVRGLFNANMP